MSETAEVIEKQEVKDLYEVGEIPPMGHVPADVCLGDSP
jgi:hypothetical protein